MSIPVLKWVNLHLNRIREKMVKGESVKYMRMFVEKIYQQGHRSSNATIDKDFQHSVKDKSG